MYLMNAKLVQISRNTRVVSFGCPCIDVFDGFTHGITAATLYASMENNGHPVSGNRFFGLCLLGTLHHHLWIYSYLMFFRLLCRTVSSPNSIS